METPARKCIRLFGVTDLSETCKVSRVQVHRWDYPKEKGGAGGDVPSRHHPTILRLAKRRKIKLSVKDLNPKLARAAQ